MALEVESIRTSNKGGRPQQEKRGFKPVQKDRCSIVEKSELISLGQADQPSTPKKRTLSLDLPDSFKLDSCGRLFLKCVIKKVLPVPKTGSQTTNSCSCCLSFTSRHVYNNKDLCNDNYIWLSTLTVIETGTVEIFPYEPWMYFLAS
uniref:Uncharacterized protein n=1 Tax=Cacopsylla melanoneura TaxID=428564 RepID=A0A8D8T2G5_9HEMI